MREPVRPGRGAPIASARGEASVTAAVRRMFAAVAPRYDLLNHVLSLGIDIAWRRATVQALAPALGPGSCVADLCCGTGDLSLCLGRQSAGLVAGVDFCHPMLALARQKASALGRPIYFLEANALCLPFPDQSLDAVTTAFGFRNLANYDRGITEMWRVLKSGGRLAILEFSRVRWPVFGPVFRFYFRRVLPRVGTWISGVAGPYEYLPNSVAAFPDQDDLAGKLRAAGFQNVRYVNLDRKSVV
jgi:demethylmenaquinone methyltransferase / 2-methoxy-6-polyprenyl-1,4-benzoquinol methylase